MSRRRTSPSCASETGLLLDVLLESGLTGSIPAGDGGMRPTIEPDDRVIVTPFLGLPCPGQIVMARHRGGAVARRLLDVRMNGGRRRYRLGEDTPPHRTFEVLREDLLGRPVAILRGGLVRPLEDGRDPRTGGPRRSGGRNRRPR